ncbi:MAG TPA: 50S ribosomal protein L1, partial [Alphaproteobacteria bacterium]|nr:50S ribosomal protein L1 [Alphaproteobacteria bacterium]
MAKLTKRARKANETIDRDRFYPLEEAIGLIKDL